MQPNAVLDILNRLQEVREDCVPGVQALQAELASIEKGPDPAEWPIDHHKETKHGGGWITQQFVAPEGPPAIELTVPEDDFELSGHMYTLLGSVGIVSTPRFASSERLLWVFLN